MPTGRKPDFTVQTALKRYPGQPLNEATRFDIGAAWLHADAAGITVKLSAQPINGTLYLRHITRETNDDTQQG
jgi:hypothetical protein